MIRLHYTDNALHSNCALLVVANIQKASIPESFKALCDLEMGLRSSRCLVRDMCLNGC